MRIAIIGTGIAGLGAAHHLYQHADVTLFERSSWIGGHSHTVDMAVGDTTLPVDTGFIVYNEVTYPLLTSLFEELKVPTEASNMSFAIGGGPVEYEGSARGMFATPTALARPSHWRMIRDILAFNRQIRSIDIGDPNLTIGELTAEYSEEFRSRYLFPMGAAIWSTPVVDMGNYPAATFARFFRNHGLVQVRNRPEWRTVTGGSRQYVDRLIDPFRDRIHTNTPVVRVDRTSSETTVTTGNGTATFDRVIFATHADTTLNLLGDEATHEERSVLSHFRYSKNLAVAHTDARLMPASRKAWASWNVLASDAQSLPTVTYWMNRLQNLTTDEPVFVTLNPPHEPTGLLGQWEYDHPMFDRNAIAAQSRIPEIQGTKNSFFCGAYTRYGFHEDGLMSGYAAAEAALAVRA